MSQNRKEKPAEERAFEIRIATEEDRAKIDIWNTFVLTRSPIYAGCLAGEVVAYLQYSPGFTSPHIFHIHYLEVHPDHRRKHYALALVVYMQDRFDVTKLVADSVQWDAIAFWKAAGFLPDGKEAWIRGEDEHAGDFEWNKAQIQEKQYQALRMDNAKALNDLVNQLPATSRIIARMVPWTDPNDAYEIVIQARRSGRRYEVVTSTCQDWRICYYLYREDDFRVTPLPIASRPNNGDKETGVTDSFVLRTISAWTSRCEGTSPT